MKILHVIATVHRQGGGTSEVVPRLCQALAEGGDEIVLATLKTDDVSIATEKAIAAGVKYVGTSPRFAAPGLTALGYSSDFKRQLEKYTRWADLVHVHGLWMWPMWAAGWEARRQGKPFVMMPHGFLDPERLKISKWKKRFVGAFCDKPLLQAANGIVATSKSELNGIRQYGISCPAHVMPIGIDLSQYAARESPADRHEKTLLYFSRITPIKGLDLLADAWGQVAQRGLAKGWKLLIVGPDDRGYAEAMKKLYAEKCLQGSFEFRGPVFGADKFTLLQSVDAMILPTRSENWSIAVAEGMASGLPVVCTKGAPWECLNTAKAGWWVDVSVDAIRLGLEQLLALSDDERHKMGLRGRKWVEDNLLWGQVATHMIGFYRRFV